jgi:hypothetical protein
VNASRVVLLEDPYNRPEDGEHMEFRLTYNGPLLATQRDPLTGQRDSRADHKHELRRRFHVQLKRLWEITPFLINAKGESSIRLRSNFETGSPAAHDIKTLSSRYSLYGFNFVPLVTPEIELFCSLEILFLRPDRPGGVVWAGDIDNRIKTLLDALRIPVASEDYSQRTPADDEKPLFCLLEDDKLITKLSVETDQLLEFSTASQPMNDVRLVITVRVWPYSMHLGNMEFGGG